jgi:AcrR family transcriptional regulator
LVPNPTTSDPYDLLFSDVESEMSRRLLRAALTRFAEVGYHAATTREIADRCGLSTGGVYVHFRSKLDLLYALTLYGTRSSLGVVEAAAQTSAGQPHVVAVREIIRALARWHIDYQELARVVAYEQRVIPRGQADVLRRLRRRFSQTLEAQLIAGHAAEEMDVADPAEMTQALLSMCTDIARWYRPGRSAEPDHLVNSYGQIAARLVRPDS